MGSFYQGGSPSNYTIGGVRFWFNRLVDDTVSPNRYQGYQDMGNVVDSNQEQTVELQDHYTSKSGTRRKDRSLVKQIEEDILFTLDEISTENLRTFFRGGDVTNRIAVPATASGWAATTVYAAGVWVKAVATPDNLIYLCTTGGTSDATEPTWPTAEGGTVTDGTVVWTAYARGVQVDEIMQLVGTELRILGNSLSAENIVVKDITGVTTHTLTTDYTVEAVLGGYYAIKRVVGGGITDGDFVRVGYDYATRLRKTFSPATETEIKGQALFFGVSDTGNEFMRSIALAQIEPEGSFALNDDDWSSFQLRLKILDNTAAVPTAPFGLFHHFGVGSDI
jgi:hypothetical protein